jgi:hypothetical protein
MNVLDKVRVIVYRYHEKGLEIFLVNTAFDEETWHLPFEEIAKYTPGQYSLDQSVISLEPVKSESGDVYNAVAIEGDWHDIPSIRKLVKGDVKMVTSKLKWLLDQGTFFAMKEAFKKVLPAEYEVLHELKEILTARNLLTNI